MSRKRSDTRPEHVPCLMLDENMSSLSIAEALRQFTDWKIELHLDYLPRGASDVTVIELCAQKQWTLISIDDRIRFVPENRQAAERVALQAFMMVRRDDTIGVELSSALVAARRRILTCLKQNHSCGFFSHVYLGGDIKVMNTFGIKHAVDVESSQARTIRKYGRV